MSAMLCKFNVEVSMRDGVTLRGDLYKPAEQGAFPVLLWRTVFRKNTLPRAFGQYDPAYFVRRGYAVFIQDVRGLGESDGEFDRFTADGKDGYDTIEWLAAQPYCDGNVGMIGNYYAGYMQLMAAAESPPHLKAICPMQTSVSLNRDCDNRGFMFYSHIGWCISRQISRLRDGRYDTATTQTYLPMLLDYMCDYHARQLLPRPHKNMPAVKNTPFKLLKEYYTHLVDGYDIPELIRKEGRDMDLSNMRVPAFYIAGWLDSPRTAMVDHCRVQRENGTDSRVLIAPWQRGELPSRADGALETGETAVDIQDEMVQWFDCCLKGGPKPAWKPFRYYDIVTGTAWEADRWDDRRDTAHAYYLISGRLLAVRPPRSGTDAYQHDPAHPLPNIPLGPADPPEPEGHETLCYLSNPAQTSLRLRGLVRAQVFLSSDAKDVDVVMRLYDLDETGGAFVICDGATRARYRNGWTPEPLETGTIYPIRVLMGYVCYTVMPGHQIALTISGSAFPKYDVNYGTGIRPPEDTGSVVSHNSIHYSGEHPSCIFLPL